MANGLGRALLCGSRGGVAVFVLVSVYPVSLSGGGGWRGWVCGLRRRGGLVVYHLGGGDVAVLMMSSW